jgi:hypothetical protein
MWSRLSNDKSAAKPFSIRHFARLRIAAVLASSLALPYIDATGFSQAHKLRGPVQRDNWMKSP